MSTAWIANQLDRDVAPEPFVERLVDHAHAALAQLAQHPIAPDAGQQRSGLAGLAAVGTAFAQARQPVAAAGAAQ